MRNLKNINSRRCDKEVEIFVGYCDVRLKRTLTYNSIGDISDDEVNQIWDVNFNGIGIISNKDFTEFEVGHEVCYPGTFYEPDDYDYQEVGKYPTLQEALWEVLKIMLKWEYNSWLESQWVEECIGELEDED